MGKTVPKPSSFKAELHTMNQILKVSSDFDYMFLVKFVCCETIMKQLLRWYKYRSKKQIDNIEKITLDGRSIAPALNMYFGNSQAYSIVNIPKLFHSNQDSSKMLRNKIAHTLPKKTLSFSKKKFKEHNMVMDDFLSLFK
ncbi:hypothetical protein ACYSNU_16655 [Enterococcus sp. LJL120]